MFQCYLVVHPPLGKAPLLVERYCPQVHGEFGHFFGHGTLALDLAHRLRGRIETFLLIFKKSIKTFLKTGLKFNLKNFSIETFLKTGLKFNLKNFSIETFLKTGLKFNLKNFLT